MGTDIIYIFKLFIHSFTFILKIVPFYRRNFCDGHIILVLYILIVYRRRIHLVRKTFPNKTIFIHFYNNNFYLFLFSVSGTNVSGHKNSLFEKQKEIDTECKSDDNGQEKAVKESVDDHIRNQELGQIQRQRQVMSHKILFVLYLSPM